MSPKFSPEHPCSVRHGSGIHGGIEYSTPWPSRYPPHPWYTSAKPPHIKQTPISARLPPGKPTVSGSPHVCTQRAGPRSIREAEAAGSLPIPACTDHPPAAAPVVVYVLLVSWGDSYSLFFKVVMSRRDVPLCKASSIGSRASTAWTVMIWTSMLTLRCVFRVAYASQRKCQVNEGKEVEDDDPVEAKRGSIEERQLNPSLQTVGFE